jgi:hypothetical protein
VNNLDGRLHALATAQPDAEDLPARAAAVRARGLDRRTRVRRRRSLAVAVPAVLAVVALGAVALRDQPVQQSVETGPDTAPAPSTTAVARSTTFGEVDGLVLTASPTNGLHDGDLLFVRIEGLDQLTNPLLLMCAGDVTPATALDDCDLRSLERVDTGPAAGPHERMTVSVRRELRLARGAADPNDLSGQPPYDCATEPAGCVLAIGEQANPRRAAILPLRFAPTDAQPTATPRVRVDPVAGLQDRQPVVVTATGLRPNTTYSIRQCDLLSDERCDELTWPTARTDAGGDLRTEIRALTVLYGWKGRFDCTTAACQIAVVDDAGRTAGSVPVSFASDAVAPIPVLSISPTGPYRDQQEVTVTGTGFPPGADLGGQIGQCPDGLDTAVEQRCGYSSIGSAIVADDGTLELRVRLTSSLLFTGPCHKNGCHLGWVLNHGPTVAKVPLEFDN